jgi:hypothetical protein
MIPRGGTYIVGLKPAADAVEWSASARRGWMSSRGQRTKSGLKAKCTKLTAAGMSRRMDIPAEMVLKSYADAHIR